jgi:ketosteroid isomerase-like protein
LAIERYVETDREQVSKLIYTIAAELERNDADAVMKHVVSSRPELASRGRAEMAMHKFESVEVTAIHNVVAMPDHQPPQVEIEFNVVVGGTFMDGQVPLDTVHRFIRLTFWKDHDGQWRIADYDHAEPQAALFKRD